MNTWVTWSLRGTGLATFHYLDGQHGRYGSRCTPPRRVSVSVTLVFMIHCCKRRRKNKKKHPSTISIHKEPKLAWMIEVQILIHVTNAGVCHWQGVFGQMIGPSQGEEVLRAIKTHLQRYGHGEGLWCAWIVGFLRVPGGDSPNLP